MPELRIRINGRGRLLLSGGTVATAMLLGGEAWRIWVSGRGRRCAAWVSACRWTRCILKNNLR